LFGCPKVPAYLPHQLISGVAERIGPIRDPVKKSMIATLEEKTPETIYDINIWWILPCFINIQISEINIEITNSSWIVSINATDKYVALIFEIVEPNRIKNAGGKSGFLTQ
jgi:hypothetical protein